ncbi:MAG: hypothetical protein KJO30_11375 [Boseongicola sp.]|nr:hypothetical protein [Boseongicola sp.]
MKLHYAFLGAAMLLAACGGASDTDIGGGGGGGGGGENPVPETPGIDPGELPVDGTETCGAFVCSGDVSNITFDGTTLTLTGLPFDDDPEGAVFTLLTTVTGTSSEGISYDIYENQDTTPIPGFNRYLAVHKTTDGGEITVGVAAIEGYAEFGYSGAWYDVDNITTTIPTLGLVEYTGDYAGTLTFAGPGLLYLTDGEVEMQVDFTDSRLKGFITDRDVYSVTGAGTLTDVGDLNTLVLNDAVITDGSFEGTVTSYDDTETPVEGGTYQGFFGGGDAAVIGGLVQATGDYDLSQAEEDPNEDVFTARDLGVFTANCTAACPTSP